MTLKFPIQITKKDNQYSSPFEALVENVKPALFREKTFQSLNWYRKKVREKLGQSETTSFSDPVTKFRQLNPAWNKRVLTMEQPGWFYAFTYNPKHKKTLPYYDRFPFIMMLELYSDGFLGLNMHYLSPVDRARFMSRLYQFETNSIPELSIESRIKINYEVLKKSNQLAYYKPCLKRYLYSHVGSLFIPIYRDEWDVALFLPTEKFTKKPMTHVFEESKKKYKSFV